ncbi:YafY family protein [Devosia sp. XK-2]|uniref:helix-turn-helix transcriptional regulator n=1 Tax=Devosia sp. XK-2 TaxID=3126689 RepID=UPI0030CB0E88
MRRADRLFQIIQILRRSNRPVTGAALAAELEVSPRTVYRDVAALMAQRVPIQGEAGFGYLLADEYDMPPLMLTPAELEAMVLGAQWVAMRGDPQLSPAALDVLAKIVMAVPAHLRPFVAEPSTAARTPLNALAEQADTAMMREAIRRRMKMFVAYAAEDDKRTERTVWPVVLGYSDTQCVLIAWCELRQAFRHFRTDRIVAAEILDLPIPATRSALARRWEAWRTAELAQGIGSTPR